MKNGTRLTFKICPAIVLAGRHGNFGYQPVPEIDALMAVQWMARRLLEWKTELNIYDMVHTNGGCGHQTFPSISLCGKPGAFDLLQSCMSKLANPGAHPHWDEFARAMLGYRGLEKPITIRQRNPDCGKHPIWLAHLHGVRLKESPNSDHPRACWLHGAVLRLSADALRWQIHIAYSYRDESSSWAFRLEQQSGEKFEDFIERAWQWFEPQVQWRHGEAWYQKFYASSEGMKRDELKNLAECERRKQEAETALKTVFYWGRCEPDFENQIANRLLGDATNEQFRENRKVEMTDARLRQIKQWIGQDNARSTKRRSTHTKI